jgi:hypothetical protein
MGGMCVKWGSLQQEAVRKGTEYSKSIIPALFNFYVALVLVPTLLTKIK